MFKLDLLSNYPVSNWILKEKYYLSKIDDFYLGFFKNAIKQFNGQSFAPPGGTTKEGMPLHKNAAAINDSKLSIKIEPTTSNSGFDL